MVELREWSLATGFLFGRIHDIAVEEETFLLLRRYEIDYKLITTSNCSHAVNVPGQEACRVALLIFLVANYQLLPPSAGPFRTLVVQLQKALYHTDLAQLWARSSEVLMWILFLGAHVSNSLQRSYFIALFVKIVGTLELRTWEDARRLLTGCFYLDRVYQDSFKLIWKEASNCQYKRPYQNG